MEFSEIKKSKTEGTMPRGGKRPGAGRPRKPEVTKPAIQTFDLTDRLRVMPGGNEGQRARLVLALAARGASESEIAAVLDVPISSLSETDRYHMQIGLGAAQGRLVDLLWKRAEAGNASVAIWLFRQMEKAERWRQTNSVHP
jgi:hypothetical protein